MYYFILDDVDAECISDVNHIHELLSEPLFSETLSGLGRQIKEKVSDDIEVVDDGSSFVSFRTSDVFVRGVVTQAIDDTTDVERVLSTRFRVVDHTFRIDPGITHIEGTHAELKDQIRSAFQAYFSVPSIDVHYDDDFVDVVVANAIHYESALDLEEI